MCCSTGQILLTCSYDPVLTLTNVDMSWICTVRQCIQMVVIIPIAGKKKQGADDAEAEALQQRVAAVRLICSCTRLSIGGH